MSYFESNESKYVVTNVKDILNKNLILSKPLNKNEAKSLNLSNTHFNYEEENPLPKQWFCSINIGEWEDVEIIVQGNNEKPYTEFIEMAEQIFNQLHQHLSRALKYLKEFFPALEVDDFYLSTISFGNMVNFTEHIISGFSVAFYGDYPYDFQYKVKFKEDGWPIGFEGGPL